MKIKIIVIYSILFSITCFGQEKINKIRNHNWISVDYIRQMEKQLPCQCTDSINFPYYISIASQTTNNNLTEEGNFVIPEVFVRYIIHSEPDDYYIISIDFNKYVISATRENLNEKTYELTLYNDTLSLIDCNNNNRKFIKSSYLFNDNNDKSTGLDNIVLLNRSLLLRGYPSIQKILKEKNLIFNCSASQGNNNMIYSLKNTKSWIFEIIEGYLYIRKVTNPNRDPLEPIKTSVVKILKWNKDNNSIPIYEKTKVFEISKWTTHYK